GVPGICRLLRVVPPLPTDVPPESFHARVRARPRPRDNNARTRGTPPASTPAASLVRPRRPPSAPAASLFCPPSPVRPRRVPGPPRRFLPVRPPRHVGPSPALSPRPRAAPTSALRRRFLPVRPNRVQFRDGRGAW